MEPDALVYEDKLKNLQETFGVSAEDTQLDVLEETQGEPERVSTPMSRKEESPVKSTVTQPALAPKNLLQAKVQLPTEEEKVNKKIVTFNRTISDCDCSFILEDDKKLLVTIQPQLDSSTYTLQVTNQNKKGNEQLNLFESVEEIYEYLHENSLEGSTGLVGIDEQNSITMKVISSLGKKERQKLIVLKTTRLPCDSHEYVTKSMKKMSKAMSQIKMHIKGLQQKEKQLNQLSLQISRRQSVYGMKVRLKPDKTDLHYTKFLANDGRFKKIVDNTTYFNLVGFDPIHKTGISYFDVQVVSSLHRNIMIGVGSKEIKGMANAYTSPQFIGFYLFGDGYIWQKSNQRELHLRNLPIQNGVTTTCYVNLTRSYINWEICGVKVAYAVLHPQLRAKTLFPIVMMININDTVEVDR